jgi:hypothetical protein
MDLICRMCGDDLAPDEFAQLQQTLRDDPVARQRYYDFIELHGDLSWTFGKLGTKIPRADAQPEADVSPAIIVDETPTEQKPPRSPVLGFLGGVVDQAVRSRNVMFWSLCIALAGYFAVQFGALLLSRSHDQNAHVVDATDGDGRHFGDRSGGQDATPDDIGNPVVAAARLTSDFDCQWEIVRPADGTHPKPQVQHVALPVGTRFPAGKRLALTNGLAELTFSSGAKVILHAPAQFAVAGPLEADLQLGKLTAKVPHSDTGRGAAGFTVATPSGKVVDLGTEFGVNVADDHTMHVVVFVGEVIVNSPSTNVSGTNSGGEQVASVKLKAGQAVSVAPGQSAKVIRAEEEHFVRDLATLGDKTAAEAAYVEFVKKLKPAVWFRMEGKESERVLHDEMGGSDAKLSWDGPGNPFVKGPAGKSLWLRGEVLRDGAVLADYPKADHNKLTVAAWAYADSHRAWATIAKNWGEPGGAYGQFSFELCCIDRDSYDICARISQNDGNLITVREGFDHPFPLYEWQHVAFVADGANLRLYRQGREVAAVKYASLKYPAPFKALGIGVRTPDDAKEHNATGGDFWSGKLDEVAVFNNALTPDEIKRLAGATPH